MLPHYPARIPLSRATYSWAGPLWEAPRSWGTPGGQLGLAAHARVARGLAAGIGVRLGTPLVGLDDARVEQVQAVEELGHLDPAAPRLRGRDQLVVTLCGPGRSRGVDVAGRVGEHEVTAGRHGVEQPPDDPVRVIRIRDQMHDHQ